MMANKSGLSSYFIGSNADRVLRHSQCSVCAVFPGRGLSQGIFQLELVKMQPVEIEYLGLLFFL